MLTTIYKDGRLFYPHKTSFQTNRPKLWSKAIGFRSSVALQNQSCSERHVRGSAEEIEGFGSSRFACAGADRNRKGWMSGEWMELSGRADSIKRRLHFSLALNTCWLNYIDSQPGTRCKLGAVKLAACKTTDAARTKGGRAESGVFPDGHLTAEVDSPLDQFARKFISVVQKDWFEMATRWRWGEWHVWLGTMMKSEMCQIMLLLILSWYLLKVYFDNHNYKSGLYEMFMSTFWPLSELTKSDHESM